jgi:hypothetical protein
VRSFSCLLRSQRSSLGESVGVPPCVFVNFGGCAHARESSTKTRYKILDEGFASMIAFHLQFFKKLMCRRTFFIPPLTEVLVKRIKNTRFPCTWGNTDWAFALEIFPNSAASEASFRSDPMPTYSLLVHFSYLFDNFLLSLKPFFRKALLLLLYVLCCWS